MPKKNTFIHAGDRQHFALFVDDECIWQARMSDAEDAGQLLALADNLAKAMDSPLSTVHLSHCAGNNDQPMRCDWMALKESLVKTGVLPQSQPFELSAVACQNDGENHAQSQVANIGTAEPTNPAFDEHTEVGDTTEDEKDAAFAEGEAAMLNGQSRNRNRYGESDLGEEWDAGWVSMYEQSLMAAAKTR